MKKKGIKEGRYEKHRKEVSKQGRKEVNKQGREEGRKERKKK